MENILKQRLAAGDVCVGAWLQSSSVTLAEAMVGCGFDWLAVDAEHGTAGVDQAQAIYMACECHGVTPLIRLRAADPYLARQHLDAGARGVIVPVVEDVEAFRKFLQHCYYPPVGRRGVGLARCNQWGEHFSEYLKDFKPVIVPQIETKKGVAVSEELARMDEVDALFLGPYDLSADLGGAGDFFTQAFKDAVAEVARACEAAGKPMGGHQVAPEPDALADKVAEGFRFVAYGTDLIAVRHAFSGLRDAKKKWTES